MCRGRKHPDRSSLGPPFTGIHFIRVRTLLTPASPIAISSHGTVLDLNPLPGCQPGLPVGTLISTVIRMGLPAFLTPTSMLVLQLRSVLFHSSPFLPCSKYETAPRHLYFSDSH